MAERGKLEGVGSACPCNSPAGMILLDNAFFPLLPVSTDDLTIVGELRTILRISFCWLTTSDRLTGPLASK